MKNAIRAGKVIIYMRPFYRALVVMAWVFGAFMSACCPTPGTQCQQDDAGSHTDADVDSYFDGDVGPDGNPDAEADSEAASPCECNDSSCGVGDECVGETIVCGCENVCSDGWFSRTQYAPYLQRYFCLAECESSDDCPSEGQECIEMDFGEPTRVCLERLSVTNEGWMAKLVPDGNEPVQGDFSANNVELEINGEIINLSAALGFDSSMYGLITLTFQSFGAQDVYTLQLNIPSSLWTTGTIDMIDEDTGQSNFDAILFRSAFFGDGAPTIEAIGVSGTLSITHVEGGCLGLECGRSRGDFFQVELLPLRAKLHPGI